ncbi:MAG: hypothetical protein OER98_04900 [Gammaproteobacteria bacterium]|nr:hypothetical protein [Gammaproteobacteria bacterium]
MKQLGIMVCVFAVLSSSRLAAEEWLGLDQELPALVGIDLGRDEEEDSTAAFMLALPLGDSAGYYGYYSNTELSDGGQEFDSLALATTVWFQLSQLVDLELGHFFEGNDGELEKETLGIALGLSQGNWNFRVQLDEGELLIFTRDDVTDFLDRFIPDRFDSDVSGYGLTLGWQADPWYWQASYQRFDYETDLTPLDSSRFAQFIVKSSALAQSSLLISESTSLLVGHADYDNDYSILIYQDQSAIDQSRAETLALSWQHWANPRFGYLLVASMPVPADSVGLTLGLRWVL